LRYATLALGPLTHHEVQLSEETSSQIGVLIANLQGKVKKNAFYVPHSASKHGAEAPASKEEEASNIGQKRKRTASIVSTSSKQHSVTAEKQPNESKRKRKHETFD
jgi:hypothetical protein